MSRIENSPDTKPRDQGHRWSLDQAGGNQRGDTSARTTTVLLDDVAMRTDQEAIHAHLRVVYRPRVRDDALNQLDELTTHLKPAYNR
jgi:hypothetical protein